MVEIIPFQSSDTEELFQLFHAWDRSATYDRKIYLRTLELMSVTRIEVFLAKDAGKLVGYIQLTPGLHLGREPYLEVVQILVDEGRRSSGIGGKLLAKAEESARNGGYRVVKLNSRIHRSRAHVFYESRGFQLEKVSKFYEKKLD